MAENGIAAAVRAALANVEAPGGGSLAQYPGLSDIIVTQNAVAFAIAVPKGMETAFGPTRANAEAAAQSAAEGRRVLVSLTSDRPPPSAGGHGGHGGGAGAQQRQPINNRQPISRVRHVIAVGSGKGGVGKSTCAVNFALALARQGLAVGIIDADLYGPSVPKLLGLEGKPAVREDDTLVPFESYGIKAMSIGPMLQGDQAVVWRGPMATSALRQLMRETDWGDLDVLIVDLPPGTGDIQISLCQQFELTGAVIVSTPQDLALIDARKAISMFKRLDIPILGIVENMSYFVAPDTGNRYDIFGHGGARSAAAELDVPFLGEVPLMMAIRENSDAGRPVVASDPAGPEAKAFLAAGAALLQFHPQIRS
ncbi:MAG TPA: Mrp/NBP35 family ATP-binding protein [Devosiaceae bacterium]